MKQLGTLWELWGYEMHQTMKSGTGEFLNLRTREFVNRLIILRDIGWILEEHENPFR